jgi:hypothetical protein
LRILLFDISDSERFRYKRNKNAASSERSAKILLRRQQKYRIIYYKKTIKRPDRKKDRRVRMNERQ